MPEIDRWLRPMIERKGSDLHLRAGSPPMWRLHGHLGPIGKEQPFDEEGTGWGWKVTGKIDTQDTILSTSCKMNRPS